MSEDQDKYYKISALVDEALDDNDLTEHWFDKFLRWGIRGLEELALDTWQEPKTCLLTVTNRKTVVLPSDFVDWLKIGVQVGQYCITMGINDELTGLRRDANSPQVMGLLSQHMPNGTDLTAYGGYTFFNFGGGSFFGIGTGLPSKGYFRVHKTTTCKELLLDYDYPYSKVYVEYISNGFDPCGETIVDPYFKDYVLKYIDFMYEDKNNPKATEASIFRKGQALHFATMKVRGRVNDLDKKTLLNISRKEARLSTKL